MLAWAWASADCTRTAINVLFMCRGIRFDFRMVQGWPQGSCGSMPGSSEACTSAPSPIGMTRPLPPSIPPSRADCLQIPCHFLLCLGCLAYIPLLFMRLPQYLQVFISYHQGHWHHVCLEELLLASGTCMLGRGKHQSLLANSNKVSVVPGTKRIISQSCHPTVLGM